MIDRFTQVHLIHGKSAGHNFHLVFLAMNEGGSRNLMKLASVAQTERFYYKQHEPPPDRRSHHYEGLIDPVCMGAAARRKALESQQLFSKWMRRS